MRRFLHLTVVLAALPACGPAGRAHTASLTPTGFPAACAPGEVEVMLLGTYHFANPVRDAVNAKIDDMLAPRRQAELEDLATGLARWQPQQIAVEAPFEDAAVWQAMYERHRAGTLEPNRNEIVQVGFRLADRLDHAAIYPIDYQMPIGNDSVTALYERRPELKAAEDSLLAVMQARTDSADAERGSTTVIEQLRQVNSEEGLHGGNSLGMFGALMPAGEGNNYGGPQVIAKWYDRNIRMVHHLHRIHQPGTARILVVVGSGHVPPMRNLLDEDPRFCPVTPLSYLQ